MVAFTRIPYSEALARSESQAKWMTAMGYIGLAGVAVAAAFGASSLIKVGPGCWGDAMQADMFVCGSVVCSACAGGCVCACLRRVACPSKWPGQRHRVSCRQRVN